MLRKCILILLLGTGLNVHAAGFEGIPTTWKLESYGEKSVTLWYTPSTCPNGQLTLSPTATLAEHNRLYATILAAKAGNLRLFFYYDETRIGCPITSFGMSGS